MMNRKFVAPPSSKLQAELIMCSTYDQLQSDTYLDLANKGIEVKTSQRPHFFEWSNQLFTLPSVSESEPISGQPVIKLASSIRL